MEKDGQAGRAGLIETSFFSYLILAVIGSTTKQRRLIVSAYFPETETHSKCSRCEAQPGLNLTRAILVSAHPDQPDTVNEGCESAGQKSQQSSFCDTFLPVSWLKRHVTICPPVTPSRDDHSPLILFKL